MALRQISLTSFRNLQSTTLDCHPSYNIIYGDNASGKTSFLESIYSICTGRSFKTHKLDTCINIDTKEFLIFGKFDTYKVGIVRSPSSNRIRINNETINKVSSLARLTPITIINSNCFKLVSGSPKFKREFLDWYLFHVEQSYLKLWTEHKHALKQKNALLKQKKHLSQLNHWDHLLAQYCQEISALRKNQVDKINALLETLFKPLVSDLDLRITFQQGWDSKKELIALYKDKRDKDIKFGFCGIGSHRDNIQILSREINADEVLSRGQQKRLGIVLTLIQAYLLAKETNKDSIILFDDLTSELDESSIDIILKITQKLDIQLFLSVIQLSDILTRDIEEYKLFHVEHGMIKNVINR